MVAAVLNNKKVKCYRRININSKLPSQESEECNWEDLKWIKNFIITFHFYIKTCTYKKLQKVPHRPKIYILLFSVLCILSLKLRSILMNTNFKAKGVARLFPCCLETPPLYSSTTTKGWSWNHPVTPMPSATTVLYCMHTHVNVHQLPRVGLKRPVWNGCGSLTHTSLQSNHREDT